MGTEWPVPPRHQNMTESLKWCGESARHHWGSNCIYCLGGALSAGRKDAQLRAGIAGHRPVNHIRERMDRDMRRGPWFRRRMRFGRGGGSAGLLLRLIALILLVLSAFFLIDSRIRPVIHSIAESQARNMTMQAVNDTVLDALSQEGIQYSDLVSIHKEESGRITSIETDVAKANGLQARIGNGIAQRISEAKSYEVSIPIGSLSGSELLLGRGPCLKLKMTLEASTVLQLRNQFTSAGVNQTHHQVMLDIQTHVLFITPDSYEPTEVQTSVCIAETVIVGEVPQVYAGISVGEITQK